MSKNLKIILGISYIIILIAFLYFISTFIEINRLDDFTYYKELQLELDTFISKNIIYNLIYFFIFAVIWVMLLGFGAPLLIISGILFGKFIGTVISVFSISVGALALYSIGNFFFRNFVKSLLEKKFEKYIELFRKNEFFYFFAYRFVGGLGIPFGLQNLIPILFGMKKINYFLSSLLGFIPGFFIINTIGAGLNNYIAQAENFSIIELLFTPDIYLPIIMFSSLMIFSFVIKKNFLMVQIDKNVLSNDLSPYLKQHKDNPVHWQTWSQETLQFAKQNKMPILLSIGYASCHWCHVMAHESFEDLETAKAMNQLFVNIKVDREERPDLDFIFQSSFQLFNQTGGGWPLTMFLDENGVPFMGGTYFPKVSKHGLPSFKEVLQKVFEAYKDQREKIINQKDLIIKNLDLKKNSVLNQDLEPILEISLRSLDYLKGGYKGAPKFPTFNLYETLLYFYNKSKDKKYLSPVELILKQLCSKGIYDQVEGGISRYTVDENWIIPHFEKMLYDNAQFILLLSKYCKINADNYYKNKLEQTIEFLKKKFYK